MLPDLFIISTARSGSSSLYTFLDKIYNKNTILNNKEPHFFLKLNNYKKKPKILKKIHINNKKEYKESLKCKNLSIDSSVGYFFEIDEFIKNIKKMKFKRKSKIIFLFREPFGRAKSLYLKNIALGNENSHTQFVSLLKKKTKKNYWWTNYYDNVYYYSNFLKLKKFFPQILIIDYTQLKQLDSKLNIFENFLEKKVYIDNKKLKIDKINNAKLDNVINLRNFYNFLSKDKKIYKLKYFFKYYSQFLKQKKLYKQVMDQDIKNYLNISKTEFKKFMKEIKKNQVSKGIYRI